MKIHGIDTAIRDMKARKREFSARDQALYREVGDIASTSIKQNVEKGGRPKWRPRKGTYFHPILDKTGLMRDLAENSAYHWIHSATTHGTLHIDKILSTLYGYFHQYGKGQVKRAFVLFQSREIQAIRTVFRNAFLRR